MRAGKNGLPGKTLWRLKISNKEIKQQQPYGAWISPISAELLTRATPSLDFIESDGENLYWVESRPWDSGRNVIMCHTADGQIQDLLPSPWSHQSKVHEYGGKAYAVNDDILYFVNAGDQRIYSLHMGSSKEPEPLSPIGPWRFADLIIDKNHQRLIAVCEEHHENQSEPKNFIAAISLDNGNVIQLIEGADFYGYPCISPNQQCLCWIQWHHPNMPWDESQLWTAEITEIGALENLTQVAGKRAESIFQCRWSPDNYLYFVSDRNNWWNLYRYTDGDITPVLEKEAEFATPYWQFGMSTFDFVDKDHIGCLWTENGIWHSGVITLSNYKSTKHNPGNHNLTNREKLSAALAKSDIPFSSLLSACCHHGALFAVASSPTKPWQLIKIEPDSFTDLYAPASLQIDTGYLSKPQSIQFETADQQQVQAFFYPPTHQSLCGEESELPPVITMCHGGPTGATDSALNLKIQFWTSRGFAVVDVNYRGSTGFGRRYRESLKNQWGVADVDDTVYAIQYLAREKMIDPKRCLIRGSSAGGYTVLSALTFTDTFKAGASLYGIGDLEALATDTHKFESHYLDSLVGPYPEEKALYRERSPLYHAEGLNCPIIFLQGLEDKVVPPNQAESMVKILQDKGISVEYVTFDNEGHGFRKAENIIRAMESELAFYQDVFKLKEQK